MKPTFIISSPFDTYSGYGARSRDVIKAIIATDKYDVKLLSQRWGATPFGFCENHPEFKNLLDLVIQMPLTQQPDIWAQITVPNEFQSIGRYNIGFTAGMETTLVDGTWVEGMNRMDINFVSSEHSKKAFLNSVYEKQDKQGNVLEESIQITKPMEVLFEGANLEKYFAKKVNPNLQLNLSLDSIKESFAYLSVGHWMQGQMGEDRKNLSLLVKAFYETFKNKSKKPALILKTSQTGASYMDRDVILKKIQLIRDSVNSKNLPNIYLLHGEFTDEEMNELYKAMVSLTKGEGFGRPLLEFSLSKKPIIVSGWSGHMDFISPEFSVCIGGELTNVHPSAVQEKMILAESQWFSPNHGEVGHSLKDMFENYKNYTDGGKRQSYKSKNEFSWEAMKSLLESRLNELTPEFPKQVELKLPKLNLPSLNTPKLPKLNLPKLEKNEG